MKSKLLIITPIKHIENFYKKVKKYFIVKYIPYPTKNILKKKIRNNDYLFTNPNMSKIYIDKTILKYSNIKGICTASTGTNHIDLNYLKQKKIKLLSLKKGRQKSTTFQKIRKLSSARITPVTTV